MMMFEVIKNAELPNSKRGFGSGIYPFPQLEIGDGFDAPRDMGRSKYGTDKRQMSIAASSRVYARRHNIASKFVTRLLDDNTVRCVRIA